MEARMTNPAMVLGAMEPFQALFKAVYADSSVGFIAEQAMKHLGEWANFSKGSSKV